jgi:hypothetical protein
MAEDHPIETLSSATRPLDSFWHAPAEFGVHTVVGTCIFAIIALPAIFLDFLVQKLERNQFSVVVVYGVHLAEYSLFCADLLLFLTFLIVTGWRTGKRL